MHDLYMTSGMVAQVQISILNPPFNCQFSGVKTMPTTVETGYKDTAYKNNSVIRPFFQRTKSFRTFYSKNKPAIKSEKPDIRSFLGSNQQEFTVKYLDIEDIIKIFIDFFCFPFSHGKKKEGRGLLLTCHISCCGKSGL